MTDLERLWDDLPAGRPPVHDILRAGRQAAAGAGVRRRHRLLLRPVLTAGVTTGVVGAFLAGTLVGGPGDTGGAGSGADDAPGAGDLPSAAAFQADLPAAEDCDQLLDTYVDRGLGLVTAWGWHAYAPRDVMLANGVMPQAFDSPATASRATAELAATSRQVDSDTGTNVQEEGVDEPDLVKTDGSLLVRLRDDELITYDVTGRAVEQLSSLDLPGLEDGEILLAGDTVVAVGADDQAPRQETAYGRGPRAGTRVLSVSIADPERPEVTADVAYDARLLSARSHGDTVRLVLGSGLPDLDLVTPGKDRGRRAALAHNREAVRASTIEDWLPTITAGGGSAEQLLDCTDVAIPPDELALDTVSVVGFDAATPADVDAIGLAGATDIAYESTDHLYLAASPSWDSLGCFDVGFCADVRWRPSTTGGTTYLFDLELDGTSATHVASGEVEGAVADRWAMDEVGGVLRVAVGPTTETGSFNSVVTFERDGEDLVELGRLDDLGRGEEIRSVRWFDGLAILVTFRQVDPLYAIDLTEPADPTLLSELKIPGFSSYLHPLGPDRLVGIGEGPGTGGAGWGAQAGLFDVRDLADVRRIDVHQYSPGSEALAGADPRAFTWLPAERTVLTVVSDWQRGGRVGYVSVLHLDDGRFENRMVQVEYGDDVAQVRTVPLPDGRVALVTGEDVRFLDLR